MTNEPHKKGKNQPPKAKPKPTLPQGEKTKHEREVSAHNQAPPNQNNPSPPDVPPFNNNGRTKKDGWDIASIIANILMMFFTGFILWQTIDSVGASVKSANIADSTLQEVKKQFEVLNRPILQIGDIAITRFKPNETAAIIYKLENLGNYAAKVLRRRVSMGYVRDTSERPDKIQTDIHIPTYISKESSFTENLFFSDDIISPEYYNAVVSDTLKILVIGEIDYTNEVTQEDWVMQFVIHIKPPPSKDFVIMKMDNIKKQKR